MEAHFETTLFIRNIFDSIVDLVPSIRLEIKKDGLYVCCIETNGCCIVSMFISEKDMEYKVSKETEITIQLSNILKKLKEMDKLKPITFKYKDGDDKIYFSQTNASGRASRHNSRLLSVDIDTTPIPDDIEFYAEVNISTDELSKILKILLISNEVCRISSFKNKKLLVLSSNGEFDSGREELPIDDDSIITDNQQSYFSIPYLVKFLKAGPLSKNAKICLAKDNPICIKFEVYNSYIHYYLSPKIEDENDVAQLGDEEKDDGPKIDMIKLDSDSESEYEEVMVTDSEGEESDDSKENQKEEIISDSE